MVNKMQYIQYIEIIKYITFNLQP